MKEVNNKIKLSRLIYINIFVWVFYLVSITSFFTTGNFNLLLGLFGAIFLIPMSYVIGMKDVPNNKKIAQAFLSGLIAGGLLVLATYLTDDKTCTELCGLDMFIVLSGSIMALVLGMMPTTIIVFYKK